MQARLHAGKKTARRQLGSRSMLPPGIVNTRSSGSLPGTAWAISLARNRGIGTVRDRPLDTNAASLVVSRMAAAVAAEYGAVADEAATMQTADTAARRRAVARLRRELHRIQGRDFFACPQGEAAWRAVEHLATADTAGARK
jgi:hypothetical protein